MSLTGGHCPPKLAVISAKLAYAKASASEGGEQRNRTFIPWLNEKHLSRMPQQTSICLLSKNISYYAGFVAKARRDISETRLRQGFGERRRKVQDSNL